MKQFRLDFQDLEPPTPVLTLVRGFKGVVPSASRCQGDAVSCEGASAEQWFELACELESISLARAIRAYRRALRSDPRHADACVNLGRLLHESGDPETAAGLYRQALRARPNDVAAVFNLGVALQDLGRPRLAIEAYCRAVELDPQAADAHFNMAWLYRDLGRQAAALRHLKRYKSLISG